MQSIQPVHEGIGKFSLKLNESDPSNRVENI